MEGELEKLRLKKRMELVEKMAARKESKVVVYSTRTCPYCYMAKDYLKAKGVAFEDVDVGADRARAQEMIAKSGQMGVPVIDFDGDIIIGFDKGALDGHISKA